MKRNWRRITALAGLAALSAGLVVISSRHKTRVENAYRSLRNDAVKRGYESKEEAKKRNAIRQVSEEEAWKSYLSKHKGANPSQQAMRAISEVSKIYLRNLPPEQRIEKAIQIILQHGKDAKKTVELKERIRKQEDELKKLESGGNTGGIGQLKNALQKDYEELLVFESFIIELSKQTRK